MKAKLHRISLILLSLVLASCGFALRGNNAATLSPETVFVRSAQESGVLTQKLRESFRNANLQLVPSAVEANYVVSVGAEEFASTTATVNGRARAAQYTLRLSVELTLDRQNQNILPTERLMVERSYFEDTANIAGSTRESDILREEMQQELVNQILNRLRVVTTPTNSQSGDAD